MVLGLQSSSASSTSQTCFDPGVTEGRVAQSAVMKVQLTVGFCARACWMFRNIVVLPLPGEPMIATLPDKRNEQIRYLTPSSSNPITAVYGLELADLAFVECSSEFCDSDVRVSASLPAASACFCVLHIGGRGLVNSAFWVAWLRNEAAYLTLVIRWLQSLVYALRNSVMDAPSLNRPIPGVVGLM